MNKETIIRELDRISEAVRGIRKSLNVEDYIGTSEVAELLGVSEATVRRLDESGVLPATRSKGNQRRWVAGEVAAYKHQAVEHGIEEIVEDF